MGAQRIPWTGLRFLLKPVPWFVIRRARVCEQKTQNMQNGLPSSLLPPPLSPPPLPLPPTPRPHPPLPQPTCQHVLPEGQGPPEFNSGFQGRVAGWRRGQARAGARRAREHVRRSCRLPGAPSHALSSTQGHVGPSLLSLRPHCDVAYPLCHCRILWVVPFPQVPSSGESGSAVTNLHYSLDQSRKLCLSQCKELANYSFLFWTLG